ncbi:MAG: hypothetical protein WC838_05435, partial [Candidatus Margulisiibacteriota bacterium]
PGLYRRELAQNNIEETRSLPDHADQEITDQADQAPAVADNDPEDLFGQTTAEPAEPPKAAEEEVSTEEDDIFKGLDLDEDEEEFVWDEEEDKTKEGDNKNG